MREIPIGAERAAHTRLDPDYAPSVEVFDNLTHREIHNGVAQLDPAALTTGQQAWQGSATGVADAVSQAHTEIRSLIADGWRGGAARTAAEAVRSFEQHGQRIADVMSTVAQRLGQAGDAAQTLRASVATPSEAQPDLAAALLDPSRATANSTTQKFAEHDRQDVVQAMDSIYTNAFIQAGSGVPAFPDATPTGAPQLSGTTVAAASALPVAPDRDLRIPAVQPVSSTPYIPNTATEAQSGAAPTEPIQPAETTRPAPAPATYSPATGPTSVGAFAPTRPRTAVAGARTPVTPAVATPTPTPARPLPTASGAPVAPAASAPIAVPTVPGGGAQHNGGAQHKSDDDRKRDERRRDTNSETVNGAGMGAMGGLMGGALAAGDTTRPGSGGGAPQANRPARAQDDEDDDELHWIDDDELTFLEPADEPGELIGALDPTTPPVVGEWTELE